MNVETVPTGSLSLDVALGLGGVPRGRIVEIYGPESSGKTTVALHMVAEVQKKEKTPIRIKILGAAAVIILILAGAAALFREKESRKLAENPVVQMGEDETEETAGQERKAYLELGLMEYMELEDYEMSRKSLEEAATGSTLANDYLEIIQYLERRDSNYYIKRNLEQALARGKEKLENMRKEETEGKVFLYKMPLLQGYRLLDTRDAWREVKRIGEEMRDQEAWNGWKDVENKEMEVRYYLAESYEMLEEPEKAIEEYESLRVLEHDEMKLESVYLKLEELYDETEQHEKAWEICRQSVEEVPKSEKIWVEYIRRHCRDSSIERTVCVEVVKKAIEVIPEIIENREFMELEKEYEIVTGDNGVTVGK